MLLNAANNRVDFFYFLLCIDTKQGNYSSHAGYNFTLYTFIILLHT